MTLRGPGYDVVVVEEGQAISFDDMSLRVGLVEAASVPVALGADGTRYVAAVRARTAHRRTGEPAVQLIKLVVEGGELVARPNAPVIERVRPLAGGAVEVRWSHDDQHASAAATAFAVYGGIGEVNYGAALATATRLDRRVVIGGLQTNVWWRIVVRAISAAGISDGNHDARIVVPRNDPPPALAELEVVQVA